MLSKRAANPPLDDWRPSCDAPLATRARLPMAHARQDAAAPQFVETHRATLVRDGATPRSTGRPPMFTGRSGPRSGARAGAASSLACAAPVAPLGFVARRGQAAPRARRTRAGLDKCWTAGRAPAR